MKTLYYLIPLLLLSVVSKAQLPVYQWVNNLDNGNSTVHVSDITIDQVGNVYIVGSLSGSAQLDFDPGPGTFNLNAQGSYTDGFCAKYSPAGAFIWAFKEGDVNKSEYCRRVIVKGNSLYVGSAFGDETRVTEYDLNGVAQDTCSYVYNAAIALGDFEVDQQGNVYMFGTTYGNSRRRAFIRKYDPVGNLIWSRGLGTATTSQNGACGYSIAMDTSGHIYLMGDYNHPTNFGQSPNKFPYQFGSTYYPTQYIVKYDTAGTYIWAHNVCYRTTSSNLGWPSQPADKYYSVEHDPVTDDIILTGIFNGNQDFDPGSGTNTLSGTALRETFLAKYDSQFNHKWAFNFANMGSRYRPSSILTDNQGNVYYFSSLHLTSVDMHPSSTNPINTRIGTEDVLMAKYDSTGGYIWSVNMGGGSNNVYGNAIFSDASATELYIAGSHRYSVDFDPGPGTATVNNSTIGGFYGKYGNCSAAPSQPGTINGPAIVCEGSINTYHVSGVPGASSYTWTLLGSWSGSSTTDSIAALAGSTGGNVTVTANNACGSSSLQTLSVTVTLLPDTSVSQVSNVLTAGNTNPGVTYQWLDCNNNYAIIPGATNQVYTATANGSYALSVTENGCTDTSVCYTVTGVGIGENMPDEIGVYPNPSEGIFNVTIQEQTGSLVVFDMLGNRVFENSAFRSSAIVDLEHSPKGVYLLQFNSGKQVYAKRIVIH